jgi:hypothetical protein
MNTRPLPSSQTLVIPDPPQPQSDKPLRVSTQTPVGEIYIDRGQPLPDRYPGVRLQALIRDPGTIFVYWEPPEALACDGWVLVAKDANDEVMQVLRLPFEARQGYLYVAALEVATVSLYPAEGIEAHPMEVMKTRLVAADLPLMVIEAPAASWSPVWTGAWAAHVERWAVLRPPLPEGEEAQEEPVAVSMPSPLAQGAAWQDTEEPMAGSGGGSGAWSGTLAGRQADASEEDGR